MVKKIQVIVEIAFIFFIGVCITKYLQALNNKGIVTPYLALGYFFAWMVPCGLIIVIKREPLLLYGISVSRLKQTIKAVIVCSAIILPIFFIFFFLYQTLVLEKTFIPKLGKNFWLISVSQFSLVAIPEEFFFRGYAQTKINSIFNNATLQKNNNNYNMGLILAAVLFAVLHWISWKNIFTLTVFFPGLIFGWLREKTGTIVAPVIFHALCNITLVVAKNSFL